MEIRARYFLVGLFVLVVAAAVVGFIFWLYSTGGLGERTAYRVSFTGSVSGLAPGSPVLFNGLQVGEVTGLTLSQQDPSQVIARIAIDSRTPVRSDTHVGMDFRGLTGTATIALTGGSATAGPPSASEDGQPPLLTADPKSMQDMSNSAREALGRLNEILADNATPLKNAIASIDTFAGALAKNSDKVDAIIGGLEKFVGGGAKPEPVSFELTAPSKFPDLGTLPTSQLTVPAPTTIVALDTQRLMLRTPQGLVAAFDGYRWADSIPLIVQSRVIQGFENAGDNSIGTDSSGINGDFQLLVNIRKFELATSGSPVAEVALMAQIVDSGGSVVDAKLFDASVPAKEIDKPEAVASATNAAFGKASTDLVAWALGVMSDQEGNGGGDSGSNPPAGKADQNKGKAAPAQEPKPAANAPAQPPASNNAPAPAKPPAKAPAPAQ